MTIPLVMNDLSTTAASNFPAGTEAPSNADDFLRAIQGIVRTTNAKGADIASASTTDIGAATAEFVDITGTTTITALGTIGAGIVRTVRFTGALTLTHNATSLILPGSTNITTANGDCAIFRSLGSGNWKCIVYQPVSGSPLTNTFVDSIFKISGSSDATKLLAFEVDTNIPTATTRTITAQNINGTIGMAENQLQPIAASVAANALTITLNPTVLAFRSATSGSGSVNVRAVNNAISLVIPSGATLGTVNAVQSRIVVLAIDNSGTVELAVANAFVSTAGGNDLSETRAISTTAISGSSNSSNIVYSTTSRSNVPYRIVGYVESTQATAGTWATDPSTTQGAGGQAISAMSSLGYSQTYQNMTASRAFGTTYTNTTGRAIAIYAGGSTTAAGACGITPTINGNTMQGTSQQVTSGTYGISVSFIVPPGGTYSLAVTQVGTLLWYELR